MLRLDPVTGRGQAHLFELDFLVSSDAPAGDIPIDLQWAVLNDTGPTLNPAPLPGPDVTDAHITIIAPVVVAPVVVSTTPVQVQRRTQYQPSAGLPGDPLLGRWPGCGRPRAVVSTRRPATC